ncbi:MAG: hypothetical protein M1553_01015 [Firmicutes bacterium]|nr:hypothetical protein [Bacillota bacterium]
MGKSLGLGSVELNAILHLQDRQKRYQELFSSQDWEKGERGEPEDLNKPEIFAQRVAPFVHHLLGELGKAKPGGFNNLADVPRMKMLLEMLSWPGPTCQATEYMKLEQFKNRPVLPDPLAVEGQKPGTLDGKAPTPHQSVTQPRQKSTGQGNPKGPADRPEPNLLKNLERATSKPITQHQSTNRELVEIIGISGGGKGRVRTPAGEEISCSNLPPFNLNVGMTIRADVTRENGKATRAVFKSWK